MLPAGRISKVLHRPLIDLRRMLPVNQKEFSADVEQDEHSAADLAPVEYPIYLCGSHPRL